VKNRKLKKTMTFLRSSQILSHVKTMFPVVVFLQSTQFKFEMF